LAIPVLIVLAVLWAAFFLWPMIQGRTTGRKADSIGDFTYRLGVIGKTNGHQPRRRKPASPIPVGVAPARALAAASRPGPRPGAPVRTAGGMTRAQRRRRDVLALLGVAVVASLLLALLGGTPMFWGVQLLTDALLVAYVFLLVRMRQVAQERRVKLRYLPARQAAPALVLRRTASS
jgi:hypothetical protein